MNRKSFLLTALASIVLPGFLFYQGCSQNISQPNYGVPTPTPVFTPVPTANPLSYTPTGTPTITSTATHTGTPTNTLSPVPSATETGTPTDTGTSTPSATATSTSTPLPGWHFDSGLESWAIGSYSVPSTMAASTALAWDGSFGNPNAGSASLYIPFSASGQQVYFSYNPGSPINMTGLTCTVRLYLDSGLNQSPTAPGGAKIYVKSVPGYVYAAGAWVNLDSQSGSPNWITLTLDASNPDFHNNPYDPSQIAEVGVEINTGGSGSFTNALLHLDEWTYH